MQRTEKKQRPETEKTPTRKTDTDRTRTSKHRTGNERRRRKKQTGAGQRLGVGEEENVRIEVGERVQVEETQGEPQTKKVWGSPAPERERKRAHGVDEQTRQEKEEDRQIEAKHGSGREGLKGPKHTHRPLRNNNGFTKNRQKT